MRINLRTPFAEKDEAKALGARWDPAKKLWYIVDVADLTPFERWIPDLKAAVDEAAAAAAPKTAKGAAAKPVSAALLPVTPRPLAPLACGCVVPPWEDCRHGPGPALAPLR